MKTVNKLMSGVAMIAMTAFCATSFAQVSNQVESATANNTTATQAAVNGACVNAACNGDCSNGDCGPRPHQPCPEIGPSNDCIGAVGPHGQRYAPVRGIGLAARDHYSPRPLYAYGSHGLDATRTDYWNRNTAAPQYSWHGNHNHWRWGQPTALVVPPTAAFQTEYNWGVGQTRSMPIYHQFNGGAGAGYSGAQAGPGVFQNTPYWPNSTSQFGIYPVRGPW